MIRMANSRPPIAILGGGIAGLTAATYLHRHNVPFVLFEKGNAIAGLMQSQRDSDGFTYDCGVHFVTNRLAAAVGVSSVCRPMTRYGEAVHLRGKLYSYPFGLMRSPRLAASAAISKGRALFAGEPISAAELYRSQYGRALADEVAIPLTEAWSGYTGDQIAAAVGKKFGTSLPRIVMLKSAARITGRVIGVGYATAIRESSNAWHVYPDAGIASICAHQAREIESHIRLESGVEGIDVEDGRVRSVRVNGQQHEVSGVISTAPVHALPKLVSGTKQLDALQRFQYRGMVFINLKLNGLSGLKEVVTWYPERHFPFFRVSDVGMGLPFLVPEGKSHITCDIGCRVGDEVWTASDADLTAKCLEGMEAIVPGLSGRLIGSHVVRVPLAYPIYHLDYEADRQRFETGTGVEGLLSIGRNGEFAHILMEDVYWRTRWKVCEFARSLGMLNQS